jgi:hypothetical protein
MICRERSKTSLLPSHLYRRHKMSIDVTVHIMPLWFTLRHLKILPSFFSVKLPALPSNSSTVVT